MMTTRRALLQSALFLPATLRGLGGGHALAAAPATQLVPVFAGIGASVEAGVLRDSIQPFLDNRLPFVLTVDPFGEDGTALDADSDLVSLLRQLRRDHGDLVELGVHVPDLPSGDPYRQARRASDAQAAFLKLVNAYEDYADKAIVMAHTLTTGSGLDDPEEGAGIRAAGIRTVIHLPAGSDGSPTGPRRWEMASTALVHIQPGSETAAAFGRAIRRRHLKTPALAAAAGRGPLILDISSVLGSGAAAVHLADICAELAGRGGFRLALASDLPRPDGSMPSRLIVVRVDDFRMSDRDDDMHKALVAQLLDKAYPVSDAVIPGPDDWTLGDDTDAASWLAGLSGHKGFDVAVHGWKHSHDELAKKPLDDDRRTVAKGARQVLAATGRMPSGYVPPNNAFDENALYAVASAGISVFSAELNEFDYCQALDRRGMLHASNTVGFERSWEGDCPYFSNEEMSRLIGPRNDAVFMIHPQTASTPARKKQVLDMLAQLAAEPGTRLVNFSQYARSVLPAMPVEDRIRQSRGKVWVEDASDRPLDEKEKDALMRDAELAWRYFDWGGKTFSGVAPGTADIEAGKPVGYPFVTMWDLGSQILATISANRLGLIDQRAFETQTMSILQLLRKYSYRYAGVNLPPLEVAIGRQAEQHSGYDSADTGRLLIALRQLDSHTNGSLPIKALVKGWGLEKTMPGGELHDINSGRLSSTQDNSYAAYARRGFLLWGYEVKPVFSASDPESDMSDAVTTLGELQQRGRIATEPLLTEEIELGGSPHGRFAADILYAAQIERYESTGKLTCVSETAIENPPYFTYQGYQIDGAGGEFTVDTDAGSAGAKNGTAENAFVVNAKGAYLWHVARPGRYSDRLIALVRDKARIEGLGFAAGIHEATGRQVALSEINTNGLILEAIEYSLNGRSALLQA